MGEAAVGRAAAVRGSAARQPLRRSV